MNIENVPEEVLGEILMNSTIEELIEKSKVSKEWKRVIDKLWCRLLNRDYKVKTFDDCENKYKEYYDIGNKISITSNKIKKVLSDIKKSKEYDEELDLSLEDITEDVKRIFGRFDFKERNGNFIYVPKIDEDLILFFNQYITSLEEGRKYEDGIYIAEIDMNTLNNPIFNPHSLILDEFVQSLLPEDFLFEYEDVDEDEPLESFGVAIPFKLYIQAYNYHNKGNFDKDFLVVAKNYLKEKDVKDVNNIAKDMLKFLHDIAKY